ncbi:MAG: GNAT family N-acetyltransferase [Burkholderiaceae bacterium]
MATAFGFASVPAINHTLLARIEEAGLNASAPPQQLLYDGWLLRFSPGKAKRARCVNAIAPGQLPLAEKLAHMQDFFAGHKLPAMVRITPFAQPQDLDAQLHALGWQQFDDTRVMTSDLASFAALEGDHAISRRVFSQNALEMPANIASFGLKLEQPTVMAFADIVGTLRGSPAEQRRAHAQRLAASPVTYEPFALTDARGVGVACGQVAREGTLVGVYDVFVREDWRGKGVAAALTTRMLTHAVKQGARTAYLQVDANNTAARAVYTKLGFADAYGYWYRAIDPDAA